MGFANYNTMQFSYIHHCEYYEKCDVFSSRVYKLTNKVIWSCLNLIVP